MEWDEGVLAPGSLRDLGEALAARLIPSFTRTGLLERLHRHRRPFSSGPSMRVCLSHSTGPLGRDCAAVCPVFMINFPVPLRLNSHPGPRAFEFPQIGAETQVGSCLALCSQDCGLGGGRAEMGLSGPVTCDPAGDKLLGRLGSGRSTLTPCGLDVSCHLCRPQSAPWMWP